MSQEVVAMVVPIIGASGKKAFVRMKEFTDYLEKKVDNPSESLETYFLLKFVEGGNDVAMMHHLDHVFMRLLTREISEGTEEGNTTDTYTLALQREFFLESLYKSKKIDVSQRLYDERKLHVCLLKPLSHIPIFKKQCP